MALNDIQYFEPNSTDYMRMKDDRRISLTRLEVTATKHKSLMNFTSSHMIYMRYGVR